jgi:zinc D-Ala-D-Ala carboxypeptidase
MQLGKISKHISGREAIESYTAKRRGIENIPSEYELTNMAAVAENVFEPLREWVGGPIKINSFFRSVELNKAIGGSSRSQHCEGRAIDIDDTYGWKSNAEMYNYIKNNLDFDQLIWEFGTDDNPDWVHVSYVSVDGNRRRCLKAEKTNGKTTYKII